MTLGSHVIHSSCTSCGDCVAVCPTESIFYGIGQFLIDRETCHDCGVCARVCPVNAIEKLVESPTSGEAFDHEED
jgi:ferredoxin